MLDTLRVVALNSARCVDQRAPTWLRRSVRRLPWSHQAARSHRTRERWVEEYQSGEWERLHTLQEFGRYSLIAGYVRRLGSGLRILDVGCGNGPLMEELRPLGNTYVGCDLAPPAIQRALESAGSNELLLVADAEKLPFGPGSFDVVVCNEVLNYVADVSAVVADLLGMLHERGHLIVSLFDAFGAPQRALWKPLLEMCDLVDMIALTRPTNRVTWRIALLKPPASPA